MKTRLSWVRQGSETPLADVVVGLALNSVLLAMTGTLWLFASRDLAATARYTELNSRSRNTLGVGSRIHHAAPQGTGYQVSASTRWSAANQIILAATDPLNP